MSCRTFAAIPKAIETSGGVFNRPSTTAESNSTLRRSPVIFSSNTRWVMNDTADDVRTAREWEEAIGERVHATMASAEMERYFNVKMTTARARLALLQLSLFVSCRRDCW